MSYQKSWKSYQDQLDQLKSRNMGVTDEAKALSYLERIGYYRLSGYWYPFRFRAKYIELTESHQKPADLKIKSIATDDFLPGTLFSQVVELYVFDKRLRHLVGDALERIEVALRVDISHTLGKLDTFAYTNPSLLHQKFTTQCSPRRQETQHAVWLSKNDQLVDRSREDFVKHNKSRYGLPLAIWVVCEVWDFGALSVLFGGMREAEQDAIAKKYGISNGRIFATWLRSLNYLRNVCAHHSRLWNRNIDEQPKLPDVAEIPWVTHFQTDRFARARCFMLLKMVRHLLMVINPSSTWADRTKAHLDGFPSLAGHGLGVSQMGARANWKQIWDQ
ncbi:Abi family protein [Xanthomonas campestris pv. raphani]|uniref:Abi family protein n=1 Tax=Xanthomonas campestris TaxID=339 RepID=UPI002B22DFB4|nr:Abi family protein [Xanthomonas campestris]MEA9911598.1 Abi family protein [Xanthomonas campestris pv. raphani]